MNMFTLLSYITSKRFLLYCSVALVVACAKQVDYPITEGPVSPEQNISSTSTPQLSVSTSRIMLLEGNAASTAASFSWSKFQAAGGKDIAFILEACVAGNDFANAVEIARTAEAQSLNVTVEELNDRLRSIVITGAEARVDFRVKMYASAGKEQYSTPVALEVTTYQPSVKLDNKHIIRIPGNYQSWKVAQAPMIVSSKTDANEYEGYINFTNNYSQFLLVKNVSSWEDGYTFTDVGAGKIGFNGNMFALWDGAGVYKINVSTNTNSWRATRIFHFSISGSAVGDAAPEMEFNPGTQTWTLTTALNTGSFVFRANNTNEIVLGHPGKGAATGSLAHDAAAIEVPVSGKYKIVLSLLEAGNYNYGIQRIQ